MELNPAFDVHNRTAEVAVDLLGSLFGKSTLMRRADEESLGVRPTEP
jgi:arginase